jgi:alpha-amylase/alpha-mannosidase (GH57 family)
MSAGVPAVEVMFLWHHHQPDYRNPRDGVAQLPWVRLHAAKDYLDMALRLERHPALEATFNFVPSLLDQLDDAAAGRPDVLFDRLARAPESLAAADRAFVVARCSVAPRHAFDRWPAYRALVNRLQAAGSLVPPEAGGRDAAPGAPTADLLALECWFLLAWIDPMFFAEPEAGAALAAAPGFTLAARDGLLALHRRLVARVIPAYRALAAAGRIELAESPYAHPILPLLVNVESARRARPDVALPADRYAAPEDATRQIRRAMARHERAFGERPAGMWPPEGSVSPEVAELAAREGLRWIASDEGVLWASLPSGARRREALYRPWRLDTPAGPIAILFRDRELSDRIGFVYSHWEAGDAARDFLARLRRIGRDYGGQGVPRVSVILDGENCWEHYPEDGGPFLEELYRGLEEATDIRTRTPREWLAEGPPTDALTGLHTGSWIDADFHIWIGHPEKNRAWGLLARARRALVEAGKTAESAPRAWEALDMALGSDWFWWLGEDHFTPDKALFDRLFREHLRAVYEEAGLGVPAELALPVARAAAPATRAFPPLGFVRPTLDGARTDFYEWHAAGRIQIGAGGGSMHRRAGLVREIHYGFDAGNLYLRLDPDPPFAAGAPGLAIAVVAPRPRTLRIASLAPGAAEITEASGARVTGGRAVIGAIAEIEIPFAALGVAAGEGVELVLQLGSPEEPGETLPPDDALRFTVPDADFDAEMWSA